MYHERYILKTDKVKLIYKRYDNGTWVGMFGMLQRNEIDIILGPSPTIQRVEEFDPTRAVLHDKSDYIILI